MGYITQFRHVHRRPFSRTVTTLLKIFSLNSQIHVITRTQNIFELLRKHMKNSTLFELEWPGCFGYNYTTNCATATTTSDLCGAVMSGRLRSSFPSRSGPSCPECYLHSFCRTKVGYMRGICVPMPSHAARIYK